MACELPGKTLAHEGAVQAGLEKLAAELLARPWERTDGAALHIERLLIDSGYLPAVCNAVAIKAGQNLGQNLGTPYRLWPVAWLGLPSWRHHPVRAYRFRPA
jgi:hypothetical protein